MNRGKRRIAWLVQLANLCNRFTNYLVLFFLLLQFVKGSAQSKYLLNPVTDICWDCVFPMTISGVNVTPKHPELGGDDNALCFCSGTPPKAGIPISFWEPMYIIDVTRHAYKLIGLGGISIGKESIKNRGSVGIVGEGPNQSSFYHVHVYRFPILSMIGEFSHFSCMKNERIECIYLSELDPLWMKETLCSLLYPDAQLFANSLAQAACVADCIGASFNQPIDKLFWCAGCQGSLYPLNGHVAHHVGGIQASSLLVHRVLAKLHREMRIKAFQKGNFCEAQYMPVLQKSLYKVQMLYPKTQKKGPCHSLGKTNLLWGVGKSYPGKGEDFVYLVWTKRQCCLDAVKPGLKAIQGGV